MASEEGAREFTCAEAARLLADLCDGQGDCGFETMSDADLMACFMHIAVCPECAPAYDRRMPGLLEGDHPRAERARKVCARVVRSVLTSGEGDDATAEMILEELEEFEDEIPDTLPTGHDPYDGDPD